MGGYNQAKKINTKETLMAAPKGRGATAWPAAHIFRSSQPGLHCAWVGPTHRVRRGLSPQHARQSGPSRI